MDTETDETVDSSDTVRLRWSSKLLLFSLLLRCGVEPLILNERLQQAKQGEEEEEEEEEEYNDGRKGWKLRKSMIITSKTGHKNEIGRSFSWVILQPM